MYLIRTILVPPFNALLVDRSVPTRLLNMFFVEISPKKERLK
jgi:hypothetical protein